MNPLQEFQEECLESRKQFETEVLNYSGPNEIQWIRNRRSQFRKDLHAAMDEFRKQVKSKELHKQIEDFVCQTCQLDQLVWELKTIRSMTKDVAVYQELEHKVKSS